MNTIDLLSFLSGFLPAFSLFLFGLDHACCKLKSDWYRFGLLAAFLCLVLVYTDTGSFWNLLRCKDTLFPASVHLIPLDDLKDMSGAFPY